MMVYLVLLASGAARDKGIDKGGQTRPPEVVFNDGFGMKMSRMPRGGKSRQGSGGLLVVHTFVP